MSRLPKDWSEVTLNELGSFKNGINKDSDSFGHGFPFVNLMDVFGVAEIADATTLGLVDSSKTERQTYDLREGDVLFVRSSVKPSGVGLATLVTSSLPNTVFSGFLLRFRSDGRLVTSFKAYLFSEAGFRTRVIGASTVSANTNINQRSLGSLTVRFPRSKAEQESIAQVLTDADDLIATLERLISKKEAIKQGMMQQLLTGRTRLPGFSAEWRRANVGSLADQHRHTIDPRKKRARRFQHFSLPAFDEDKAPINEPGSEIDSIKFLVPPQAVLVSKLNPRIPRIWAPSDIGPNAIASTEFVVMTPCAGTDRSFLKWLMKSDAVTSRMKLLATGTTGSHARIHPRQIAALEVLVPPESEQAAIATVLDDAEYELGLIGDRLTKARAIKTGMMQQLLTGRTRLPMESDG